MSHEPYASARRVFWVVDNGSSHRGQTSVTRLRDAHDNARLIHLPVHASWLNQVEIVHENGQEEAAPDLFLFGLIYDGSRLSSDPDLQRVERDLALLPVEGFFGG